MSAEPTTALPEVPRLPSRPLVAEPWTFAVGLAFCVVALWLIVQSVVSDGIEQAPEVFRTALVFRNQITTLLVFPLAITTGILAIGTLLRSWSLRPRRCQLRLATVLILFALALVDLIVIDPIVGRILAASDPQRALLLADAAVISQWNWIRAVCIVAVGVTLVAAERAPLPTVAAVSASGLTKRHRTLLLLVGTATLFEGYDRFIASLALPYIGKDLGAGESALGYALAFIRIGALVSVLFGRLADRYGRRVVLIISVTAYTLATAATGLSSGLLTFALFQLVAAIFLATELTLAQVVIAEEFPAQARGLGQGLLSAFGAFGSGMAAMLFPVLQHTTLGWRGMYLVGVLPLLIVAYLRRSLPETRRWTDASQHAMGRSKLRDLFQPGLRSNLIVLTLVSATATALAAPTFSFASYRATNALGWTPAQVSTMILAAGSLGFIGHFLSGRLADTVGRRWVGLFGLLGSAVAAVLFYQTAWLFPAFALLTFSDASAVIAINAFGTELFPTDLRATAKVWITNSAIVGALAGLGAVGALGTAVGGYAVVVSALALLIVVVAPAIFLLPETRQRELEELTPAESLAVN